MRKACVILIILVSPLFTAVTLSPMTLQAEAWGLATHMEIASEAIDALTNSTWKEVFGFYRPEIMAGLATPDQVWQDWDNHIYYPLTGELNAPSAAQRWFNFTRDNFTSGNWEDGFFALGVMSHYFSDPNIPVHTDEIWAGHSAYETDINNNLGSLTIGALAESTVTNVSQMVVDGATYAHQYYDMVVDVYPESGSVALMTNATIKAFTENCLTNAINGCLSIFYSLTQFVAPPDVSILYEHIALVDYAHQNDYIDLSDQLTSLNISLSREGFEMRKQTTAFTSGDLVGVDLLIATCGLDAYSAAELIAISDWAVTGNKSILLTGRGDFSTYTDIAGPNQILEAVESNIRVTDDNVYMTGTYQLWYNDLDTMLAPADTLNLTFGVSTFTMFSPTSLYFLNDTPVLPVIMADHAGYQTDQTLPAAEVIYDSMADGVYGNQIPLAAVEEVGSLRILVTGTTFFSDFDYGKTPQFDNIVFLENFLEWAVGDRTEWGINDVDEIGPRFSDIQWSPTAPAEGQRVLVTVTVTDPSGVSSVSLNYNNETHVIQSPMVTDDGMHFAANVSDIVNGPVVFRLHAQDIHMNTAVFASFTVNWPAVATTTTTTTTTTSTTATTTTTTTSANTTTTSGGQPTLVPTTMYLILSVGIGVLVVVLVAVTVMKRR